MKRILDWTIPYLKEHGSETPRLDAEVLLAFARKCPRIRLYTDYDQPLTNQQRSVMRDLVRRRANAEPVAYLVGHREFFSLDFLVEPGVFIPRPETETLVIKTLDRIAGLSASRVLDLCTGSGCVAITVAVREPRARVTAIERNEIPLRVSRKNAERHQTGDRVQILSGDLFSALPAECPPFDVIVSNPPYVTTAEIATLPPEVQAHEPHAALDGGADGLDVIRHILETAPAYLKPGGWVLLEMDPSQIQPVLELAAHSGIWEPREVYEDLHGRQRCVGLCLQT